jgi:uncharacterized damage-inducible protein DinB
MTAEEARTHIRYSGWASRRLLDAAEALTEEQRTKSMGVSHGSIQETLGHIYFADRIWYKRTVEPELTMPPMTDMSSLEAITLDWPNLQMKWEAWAETLTDQDMERMVQYKMMSGMAMESPRSHIVLHLVNHATLHRGQVVGMLRQLGVKPPITDLIFYLRDLSQEKLESQKL